MPRTELGIEAAPDEEIDFSVREHEQTEQFTLSESARRTLASEVNHDQPRLEVLEQRGDQVRLKATEHVGIVSLPDGPTVEVRPKVPGTDLLGLLRYSHNVETATVDQRTSLTAGRTFIEALGALYNAELETALDQGLTRDYRRTQETESYLRGQLDVTRQLQRQGVAPTEFECTYDELTADTTVNRGVLYATDLLTRLVQDRPLSQALHRHHQQLRRHVTLTTVRPVELEQVELNRLSAHYTDLLRLTKLVLRSVYIEDLRSGTRASFALLMDMNEIFERVVERAVRAAITGRPGWSVEGQASSQSLLAGGQRAITIRPDILIRDENDTPVFVGDAKWKFDDPDSDGREPSNADIYQLVSYEIAHDVPGILFYPAQEGRVASEYTVNNLHSLHTVELPISSPVDKQRDLAPVLKKRVSSALTAIAGAP